jgi:hypothetical protein
MKYITMCMLAVTFVGTTVQLHAEGKAEPTRIKFSKGTTSKTLKGSLSGDEEQEYVLGARKGQTIYITNSSSDKFAYRLVDGDGINQDSTDLAVPTMEFHAPKSGDFVVIIRRLNPKPISARFSITIAVQ